MLVLELWIKSSHGGCCSIVVFVSVILAADEDDPKH